MANFIPLREWANNHFSIIPSQTTLSAYAKTKQISPPPFKFGGRWMCDKNATFTGLNNNQGTPITDPLVAEIFYHATAQNS